MISKLLKKNEKGFTLVEIAGQSVAAWDKGHKVVYTFDAAANHFAISTAE